MKRIGVSSLVFFAALMGTALAAPFPTSGTDTVTAPNLTTKQITKLVEHIVDPDIDNNDCVGVSVGLRTHDASYEYYFGDTGNNGAPSATTVWRIGSITKVFTTTLLGLAVHAKDVKLTDPAQNYMPSDITLPIYKSKDKIEFVDLAAHESGLPRDIDTTTKVTYADYRKFLNHYKLTYAPGTKYLYSNLGIGVLAQAFMNHTGEALETLYNDSILKPLGMTHTTLNPTTQEQARIPVGYTESGKKASQSNPQFPVLAGAGALYSTLPDMVAFLAYQLGEKSANKLNAILTLMHTPQFTTAGTNQVGLGWQFYTIDNIQLITKDGYVGGFETFIAFYPATHTGVVVLSNKQDCPVQAMSNKLMEGLNGLRNP